MILQRFVRAVVFLLAATALPSLFAQPTRPGVITVSDVTEQSAIVRWGASTAGDGVRIVYELQLRKRINGVAQPWSSGMETTDSFRALNGLSAGTVYEARVRAWSNERSSEWQIKENAFTTTGVLVENRAPTAPGAISVGEVTSSSARVSWGAAQDPDGDVLAYIVQLRKRVEGVAQSWVTRGDPRNLYLVIGELSPGTVYDVRVAAFDGKKSSEFRVVENALRTTGGDPQPLENHVPSTPGEISISEITPSSARMAWGVSTDADGDPIKYLVALRKRINGVAQPWGEARDTVEPRLLLANLANGILYEVRVQAFDGKSKSAWRVKENAFLTPASFATPPAEGVAVQNGRSSEGFAITWPVLSQPLVLEFAESPVAKVWTPVQQPVESSGGVAGLVVGTDGPARFFRLRKSQ
jgi:hypothetical protein